MYFGGRNCSIVHSVLSSYIPSILVFSICSDERLINDLECYLYRIKEDHVPDNIVVLGDFVQIPPKNCRVSMEVLRLLSLKSDKLIKVSWIDGGTTNFQSANYNDFKWEPFSLSLIKQEFPSVAINRDVALIDKTDSVMLASIKKVIGSLPNFELDNNNKVISISFLDSHFYPRSFIDNISRESFDELWLLLSRLHNLRYLNISFSGINYIPDVKFDNLERLDARGNRLLTFESIECFPNLTYLNISACGLKSVPANLRSLIKLEALLCYKNLIETIDINCLPSSIVRLSLYRNLLKGFRVNLKFHKNLSEINIGANPLQSVEISNLRNCLRLRVRNLDPKLIRQQELKGSPMLDVVDG